MAERSSPCKDKKKKYDIKPERKLIRREHNKNRRKQGYHKEYYRNNIDKFKFYRHIRESNKKHVIDLEEWHDCLTYFNCACAYCGMSWENHFSRFKQDLHKEHIVHDGKDNLSNCVPSCRECNSEKSVSSFNGWYNVGNNKFSRVRYLRIYAWLKEDYKKYIKKNLSLL